VPSLSFSHACAKVVVSASARRPRGATHRHGLAGMDGIRIRDRLLHRCLRSREHHRHDTDA
jgi:hypothetical protein